MNNSNSALPNMSNTIVGWFLNISFEYVERVQDGADWVETTKQVFNTKGVVQPPSMQELKIYPEGMRGWEWLQIHVLPDVDLPLNQFIRYDGRLFKIMSKKDWRKYGYIKYVLLEAYRAENL